MSGCLGESPGVARDASEAWHCDEGNVSVALADVMTNCPTMENDSNHKCWKVEGCGKTAFVPCSLSPVEDDAADVSGRAEVSPRSTSRRATSSTRLGSSKDAACK
jgi:hypothetical protein